MKIYKFRKLQIATLLALSASISPIGIAALLNVSLQNSVAAQVIPDKTLGAESSFLDPDPNIRINGISSDVIKGGVTRGGNLFHSFETFNVREGRGVYFDNPVGIQRILTRVTGSGISNRSEILGVLGVLGDADLFLINPNGIIFGPKASLNVKGSFIATTASNLILEDGIHFGAKESSSSSQLTVSIPVGLQFRENSGDIIQQASERTLRGAPGKTLAFVGGNVFINGGRITIPAPAGQTGRLELGSVAENGYVGLQPIQEGWALNYEKVKNFNDIEINRASSLAVASGNIQLYGKNLSIKDGSQIQGFEGSFTVSASDSIYISGFLAISDGLKIFSGLANDAISDRDAGGITINTKRFIVQDGAQITTRSSGISSNGEFTIAKGNAGDLTVNASESVQLIGSSEALTGLFSDTLTTGTGGSININTQNFSIEGGALLSATSSGVNSLEEPLATGAAGNIKIISSESIKLNNGFIITESKGLGGKAGDVKLESGRINIFDSSRVSVSALEGQAGELTIKTNFLSLNQGLITAEIGKRGAETGAKINLNIGKLLRLENESQISAKASNQANGGNIRVNAPILLTFPASGLNGSDIIANADKGRGGNITINSKGIFGIQKRNSAPGNRTNDISASSQFGPSGQVQINSAVNPTQGIEELPSTVIDPSTLVAQNPCKHSAGSEFVRSGRGGLPPSISQDFDSNSSRVGLVQPIVRSAEKVDSNPVSKVATSQAPSPLKIVPAQGWVYNDNGQAVLVAYNPSTTGPQRSQPAPVFCPAF